MRCPVVLLVGGLAVSLALAGCRRAQASIPGADPDRGRQSIEAMGCGACHQISGIRGADGKIGPPLTGIANRAVVGGVLPNTPENMMAWIEDAPSLAPRTTMPNLGVTPQAARDIVAYLYTLK